MLSKQKLNQIAKHKDFNKLLKGILDLAQDILDSEAATLFLIDHETNELIFQIVNGPTARQLEGKRIGMGDGIVGKSAELGEVLIVNKVKGDPDHEDNFDRQTGFNTESLLAAPLVVNGEIAGVIELINSRKGVYTEKSKAIIGQLAIQLSSILEIALLSERLSKSREFLDVIISSFPGGIIIINEENRIKRTNPSAGEMLGVNLMEGLSLEEALPYKEIVRKIKNAKDRDEFGITVNKEGQETHLDFTISSADEMDSSGIVKRYRILSISNTTERVELERLMYSKEIYSDFLSGISHQLRTPLTSILGLSEILSGDNSLPENVRSYNKVIQKDATRMKEMVEKLLDVATLHKNESIDMNKEIELVSMLWDAIKDFDPQKIKLKADHKKYLIRGNYKWLYKSFKQLFEMGIRDENSRLIITVKETKKFIDLLINGLKDIIPELSAVKNVPFLKFDDPLTGKNDTMCLNLSLVRLILEQHRIGIKLNEKDGLISFRFNKESIELKE